jgi:dipeptidyl aminopeptidase/acylaminoacyl peptidase
MRKVFLLSFIAVIISANLFADTVVIDRWLIVRGPDPGFPAFAETVNIKGEPFTKKELFGFNPLDIKDHFPRENKIFTGDLKSGKKWAIKEAGETGFVSLEKSSGNTGAMAYMATYISAGRWMKAGLEIKSRQMLEIYLNGKRVGTKTSNEPAEEEPGKWDCEIELEEGKHLLVIRTFHGSDEDVAWQIRGKIGLPPYAGVADLKIEMHPKQGKRINHLLDGIKAGASSLSPGAKYYATNFSRSLPPSDRSENWLEIKRVSDGKLVQSFRHASIHSFSWAPKGTAFSYRTSRDEKASLWIYDLDNGRHSALMEDIENFGSYSWAPDGSFIIYSIKEERDDEKEGLKRLLGMQDRLPEFRTRHFLYMIDVSTGRKERITHGFLSTSLHDISPDSKKILFSQSRPDYLERPYSRQDVFIMALDNKEVDTIFKDMLWGVTGSFSPDGKKLLLTGGPSSFGTIGENIPDGKIANNYDRQAYVYEIASRKIDPITREFDPSVSQAIWSKADNSIYLLAGDEDYMRLFRYNARNRTFTGIDTGMDVVSSVKLAMNEPKAVFSGSGISSPPKVSLIDLKSGKYRELENPDKNNFENVVFGQNREWKFKNAEGTMLSGRVYLPPDFKESAKYPLIVYYYGGTNPVFRSFGGRYPFNLYAAKGYVVYVLQPSGATGFGQEFSSMHVNNWGITVADEIIQATRAFLDEHPFIDPDRVGCMGASYGGFMTMLLQTRTDMFAAAISHAGISLISSYWGEGYWGYGYSAEASAGSFPWNNRDLYVGQSPLYSADRISTPLLLLHGTSDTNVPPGESIQLYVALRLLGRPVELVEIDGENHHIITYGKRIAWNNTKLAWFDKWLKDQPQWWEDMYPEKNY